MNQQEEMEKCMADPVYFYENYFTINGKKPGPMAEESKRALRMYFKSRTSGCKITLRVPPGTKVMFKSLFEANVPDFLKKGLN